MKSRGAGMAAAAARVLAVTIGLIAFPAAALKLAPVITTGLASPLFVSSAGDVSGRLYVVERGGIVRVLQPGATTPSVFLDISGKVVAGNEQGLLGLAFHPQYASNGRLFVYYTRAGDGALVIAEYRRSADPNVAGPAETMLLTIAHPQHTNHNGGMLAFGPDGYLYIGVGDGGSGNDPPNNAQNIDALLGKILRVDVDRPDAVAGTRYSAPPGNPFVNAPGRDETFAIGMRNPWRFSFDRATGALWVADVGQGEREEVNAPVVAGGNYGWRVYEGTRCTNNDPLLCIPANYISPLFEYAHAAGRCSITGGYVYRGSRGALAHGTYVYGDFCTGEIFAWDGTRQVFLLDSGISIASFGEDDEGELYVVDLGGAVSRLEPETPGSPLMAIEYHHAAFDHYFPTSLADEIAKLDAGVFPGWSRTAESFPVHAAGSAGELGVCRFYSAAFAPKSSHFYSAIANECAALQPNPLWQLEGIVFAMKLPDPAGNCPAGRQPLYRLYNNGNGGAPNHRYTTSAAIRASMLAQGWIAEGFGSVGVAGCVPN